MPAASRRTCADNALEGFELSAPVTLVAAYIRAEQELGRIRGDVDATEAAAAVVAVPFARGVERTLSPRLPAHEGSPAGGGFQPHAAGVLDILCGVSLRLRERRFGEADEARPGETNAGGVTPPGLPSEREVSLVSSGRHA